jgi:hypothetical protein
MHQEWPRHQTDTLRLEKPAIIEMMKIKRKTKKSSLAPGYSLPASRVKPKRAAMSAITRKRIATRNMINNSPNAVERNVFQPNSILSLGDMTTAAHKKGGVSAKGRLASLQQGTVLKSKTCAKWSSFGTLGIWKSKCCFQQSVSWFQGKLASSCSISVGSLCARIDQRFLLCARVT